VLDVNTEWVSSDAGDAAFLEPSDDDFVDIPATDLKTAWGFGFSKLTAPVKGEIVLQRGELAWMTEGTGKLVNAVTGQSPHTGDLFGPDENRPARPHRPAIQPIIASTR
jgi:hypothetical protein